MHPRKRILLQTTWPGHWREYSLLLNTWGYALWTRNYSDCPDAVLAVDLPLQEIPVLAAQHDQARIVALVRSELDRRDAHAVGAAFTAVGHLELRERLRTAVARKRGPRQTARRMERAA